MTEEEIIAFFDWLESQGLRLCNSGYAGDLFYSGTPIVELFRQYKATQDTSRLAGGGNVG